MIKENKNNMMIISVVIVAIVVAVLAYITIYKKGPASEALQAVSQDQNTNMQNNQQAGNVQQPEVTGEQVAKAGDTVAVNYTGSLENGTVFDSNVDPKFNHVQPFEFTLGAGQVIKGWDVGVAGMKVGEKKRLVIAPADAYGANGIPGVIPPNSTLVFDVELLAIKK